MSGGTAAGEPLRVAVIGYGTAGAVFHAPLIEAVPGMTVAALVTGNPDRAAAARSRYPAAAVLPDATELWRAADRLDLAVIATPNRTHVALAMAALEAGLHVVVDKPLAASAADARRLIDEARRLGRVLTVFQNRRWDGDFLTLRRLLDAGELGTVHRFESRFERWRPVPKPGWRQDPAPEEAGGLLYDLGAHLIDQALVLFGPVRAVHVELDRRRPGAMVDDDVFLALTHDGGVRSHLWMNTIAAEPGPRFRVLGSRAGWTVGGLDIQEEQLKAGHAVRDPRFGVHPPDRWGILHDGEVGRRTPGEAGAYTAFYSAVARSIREGAPAPVDPADAVAGLEVIEAARRQAGEAVG